MNQLGWFRVDRGIIDSEIWEKPAEWLKIWLYILSNVNYADTETMKRGSNYFRASIIANDCGCSKRTVENFLKWGKVVGMVVTHKTARGNVITVLKYDKYQSSGDTGSDATSDTMSDTGSDTMVYASGDTIKEEENNTRRKEEKKESVATFSSDDAPMLVADYLLFKIKHEKPNFKQPNLQQWAADIDKAIRIDKRTKDELIGCINWIYSKQGEFWAPNIMSGKKLREKFDTMEAQMMRSREYKNAKVIQEWEPTDPFTGEAYA